MIEKPIEYKGYFIVAQYLIDSSVPCGYALAVLRDGTMYITDVVYRTVDQMKQIIDILKERIH